MSFSHCWWNFSSTQVIICGTCTLVLFLVCLVAIIVLFQWYFRGFAQFKHFLMRPEDRSIEFFLGWNMRKEDLLSSSEVYSYSSTYSSKYHPQRGFLCWLSVKSYCCALLFSSYYLFLLLSSVTDLGIPRFLILCFVTWLLYLLLQRCKCFMYILWFYWNN